MIIRLVLLALPFALVATACSSGDGAVPTDNAWQLAQIGGPDGTMTPLTTGPAPTLVFQDGTAAGNASCNQYSGSYELDGSSLAFGPFISTEMFCGDEGVMEQEAAYLSALASVDGWSIDGETLTLSSGGETVLVYEAISQDLAGTSWDLLFYNNGTGGFQSAWGDEPVTAVFGDDGTLAGSAGCNSYTTSWATDGESIEIGPAASTKMMCPDEQVMSQEARYLELLGLADTYRVDAGTLDMFDADGMRILQFAISTG